jgi:hypothetical protein
MISAEVAALTGEVLKAMLLNKLKLTTVMLLVALALAAGGTSLSYRARATEPANPNKGSENPEERSNPAGVTKDDMPKPKDQPKIAGAAKEDMPKPKEPKEPPKLAEAAKEEIPQDPNRPTGVDTTSSPPPVETQPGVLQPTEYFGGYSFTASPTGNLAFAYRPKTQEVKVLRLNATEGHPIKVTPKVVPHTCVVGLYLEAPKITRVAVFNVESGKWSPLDLDEPASGVVEPMPLGNDALAYQAGRFFYMYSSKTSTWDRMDLQPVTQGQPIRVTPVELKHAWVVGLRLEGPKITRVAVYNIKSGKWSPLDLDEPARGVVEPMDLGPGAAAYQVGRFLYVYHSKTSTWARLDVDAEDKQDAPATRGR